MEGKPGAMSTYSLDELLRKWTQGDLTADQAIGQIVQHLKRLHEQQTLLVRGLAMAATGALSPGAEESPPTAAKRR